MEMGRLQMVLAVLLGLAVAAAEGRRLEKEMSSLGMIAGVGSPGDQRAMLGTPRRSIGKATPSPSGSSTVYYDTWKSEPRVGGGGSGLSEHYTGRGGGATVIPEGPLPSHH